MASGEKNKKPKQTATSFNLPKEFIRKVYIWTSFYRKYPFMYVEDAMNIKLKVFQKLLIYIMFHYNFVCFIASRGIGKSWLTSVLCHVRCVLFPNTQVVIASGIKSQAVEIITYLDKLRKNSDAVHREISYISEGTQDPKVDYWNGSTIRVVASNDGARGKRCNYLILDEYRLVPKDVVDMVLRKFRSSTRYCGYLKKPEYAHIKERNKEIYLSSAYYKHSWAFKHFMAFFSAMKQGKGYFACCLPYQLGVMEGIKNLEEMTEEYNEETTDELMWKMEYESYWIGNDDDMSFFKYEKIDPCRRLTQAFYPRNLIQALSKEEKYFAYMKKSQDEIRILTCDFARKEGVTNDNTSIGLIILKRIDDGRMNTSYFMREVPFLTTMNGTNTMLQALEVRRLYEWFQCDYIVLDMQNIGSGIYDAMSIPMRDPETDVEYEPLGCINHEQMRLGEVLYPNAPKKVYGISATPQLNSDIGYLMRDTISKKRINFLVDEGYFRVNVSQYIKSYDTMSIDSRGKLVQPYIQISALLNEMQGLEYMISPDTNILKLKEKSGNRKDRYSSISYGNYFASLLERDLLQKPTKNFGDLEDLVGYYEF